MSKTYYKRIGSGFLLGVTPTRDLTVEEWDALTEEQQQALEPYYKRQLPKRRYTKTADEKPNTQELD